ncbi:MAG: zinc ribbon domain-containing protein [Dehalococcoidia bacterium]|nr:MAG: zinc ribbon domain-containing protein [Dehalococcoidia bacterium]
MPTYEYKCSAGHVYETQQPFGSPAEQPCAKCGKPALRVLYAPPLVFKGGGFYKTANRGDQRIAAQQASGDSEPETKSYDAGIDESAKPAAVEAKAKADKAPAKAAKAEPKAKKADA